jgi:Ca-activated chloride channel family protein
VSGQNKVYSSRVSFPAQTSLYPEIERLWAFASIEDLQNKIDYLGEDPDSKQAIVDLALEYGLVTDYTSMVVVRDEAKAQYGIGQANADRVAAEHSARQQRSTGEVPGHRQDTQQPAFSSPRAQSASGSGALGPWALLLILPLLFTGSRRRQQ